jgi:hypothetical protein
MRVRSDLRAEVTKAAVGRAIGVDVQQALLKLAASPDLTEDQGVALISQAQELLKAKHRALKALLDAEEAWLAGSASKPSKRPRSGLSKSRPQQASPGMSWIDPRTTQRWVFVGTGGWVPGYSHDELEAQAKASEARALKAFELSHGLELGPLSVSSELDSRGEIEGTWLVRGWASAPPS